MLFLVFFGLAAAASLPPDIDSFVSNWQNVTNSTGLLHGLKVPGTSNFLGSIAAASSNNVLGLEYLTFPPITQGGDMLTLSSGGSPVVSDAYQWFAYGFRRSGHTARVDVTTDVRLIFEAQGALVSMLVDVKASGSTTLEASLGVMVRQWSSANNCSWEYPSTRRDNCWNWYAPRPFDAGDFTTTCDQQHQMCTIRDSQSPALMVIAFSGSVTFGSDSVTWTVASNQRFPVVQLRMAIAFGNDSAVVTQNAASWLSNFNVLFLQVRDQWQKRFDAAFTPTNNHYSGSLPLLDTEDALLARIYYMSVLSFLHNERSNLPGPSHPQRMYGVGGYDNATTNQFYWDYSYYPHILPLLDPAVVKETLDFYLDPLTDSPGNYSIYNSWGVEYMSQHSVGAWYAANDLSLSQYIHGYLGITGDHTLLQHRVANMTIYEWLELMANHWRSLRTDADMLADYGFEHNLLEVVPSYIHKVPSFNAANVWMMDRLAGLPNTSAATREAYANDSAAVAAAVLTLYEQGQGYYACRYPNGTQQQVRHVIDFVYVPWCMEPYLPESVQNEMMSFCDKQLFTPFWMRALSLQDPWANYSDRSDHGPNGAYDGWPPLTVNAMGKMGFYSEALDFLHRSAIVTFLGPYGQAHEVHPPLLPYKPDVFTQWVQAVGVSFADCIITTFFGFDPTLSGPMLTDPQTPRGLLGLLRGVWYHGKLVDITSGPAGLTATTHTPSTDRVRVVI